MKLLQALATALAVSLAAAPVCAGNTTRFQSLETNISLDGIVLACIEAEGHRILQLHLYPADNGPFLPRNASPGRLKDFPSAVISIDDRSFRAGVFFSDRYVIVADITEGFPQLSRQLIAAMLTGRAMVLRFDLLQEGVGQPARFDGEALIDLGEGSVDSSIGIASQCTAGPSV
jgi:hypothetical protein